VLFHRVANTLNYLDIKTVIVSCGTCMDQLQKYEFDKIFPGCRLLDIHEYLMEKGVKLEGRPGRALHVPRPLPHADEDAPPMKVVNQLIGTPTVEGPLNDRCCGERHARGEPARHFDPGALPQGGGDAQGRRALRADGFTGDVKILTSCPSCLQGLSRYDNDSATQADYIVVEMARGESALGRWLLSRRTCHGAEREAFPGFCRVVWHEHVAEMSDLSPATRATLMDIVLATERAVRRVVQPTRSTSPAWATWCRICTGT
jgi:hypothetical protein